MWENTCRTSPARAILTRRRASESIVFSALERGKGDLMREDNKVIAVSLSSEGDIEVDTSGDVGNSWRPARSPEESYQSRPFYSRRMVATYLLRIGGSVRTSDRRHYATRQRSRC